MEPLISLIRKDLRVFYSDRSAAMISIIVPLMIAVFLTMMTSGSGDPKEVKPIEIAVASSDATEGGKRIVDAFQHENHLKIRKVDAAKARDLVSHGKVAMAVFIPTGFSASVTSAMFSGGEKPKLELVTDPAQSLAVMASQGMVTRVVMNAVVATGDGDAGKDQLPFVMDSKVQTVGKNDDAAAQRAHAFAGMAVQGTLFTAINLAMGLLRDRRRGIWKRLQSSPITIGTVALSKIGSGTLIGATTLAVIFGVGVAVMGVGIHGNFLGFVLQALSMATLAACFGLFVASLGKTEEQSRGLSIFVVLMLTMLGGAWFPTFLMPQWLQKITVLIPTRWAIDGFDMTMWRESSLLPALPCIGMTFAFSLALAALAIVRLKATE